MPPFAFILRQEGLLLCGIGIYPGHRRRAYRGKTGGKNATSPQPSIVEEYLAETMGNLVSAYVELERRLPKEDGEAFYNALCLIENLLRKGHQDKAQGERNQAKRAAE